MITENVKAGILKKRRFIVLLPIILELIYFSTSLTNMPTLLRAAIVFPSLFVLPGVTLLVVLRGSISNMVKLVVEGFFVSTVILAIMTSLMLTFGFPLVPFTYSLVVMIFVVFLVTIALVRKTEVNFSKSDILLVVLAFSSYFALLLYFSMFPRYFTPDETSYIFSARMGILNGIIPPMGVRPDASGVTALLDGRCFWIYLLASFLGSTRMPAYQAGLISVGFLIMTALASSLIVKSKRLSMVVFAAVTISPLLFSFSILTLNDLAISFYAVFAVLFFVKSFSKAGDNVSLNIANLSYSLIGVIVLALIKPNLLVFLAMWIILVWIMVRYKLYKQNRKYKVLFMTVLLSVLGYELCIDLPYVISVWIFRNGGVGALFGRFLFISPIEKFLGWFLAPWWSPAAPTLFAHSFVDYLDHFYVILSPEHSSLLISAVVLTLPILIMSRNMRKEPDKTILTSLVFLSLCLFYFDAVSSASLSDTSRYSLWMIPLWIPLALMALQDISEGSSFKKLFIVLIGALIFLWINIWLSREESGVYVGYSLPSAIWTADAIMIQIMTMMVIVSLLFLREDLSRAGLVISRKLSVLEKVNVKNGVFCLLILLILLNGVYFSSQFMAKSHLHENHGLTTINNALSNLSDTRSLVFANNYISMRPYMSDEMLQQGLLLPPPETKDDFLKLLEIAPNNTLFSISNDNATTWYEYANNYMKSYTNSDALTPVKPDVSILPNLNLTNPVLKMTFDDAIGTTVVDHSGLQNNGVNYGAKPAEGYRGQALRYDGEQHVSIADNDILNVRNSITVSLIAMIEKTDPLRGYMILSKGYAPENGSYDIFVWDGEIYFSLGGVGSLSVDSEPYIGNWHHFVFAYDGEKMGIYVDGSSIGSKPASGLIRTSSFDLEIGRDSERRDYGFVGSIDELQISNYPLNTTWLIKSYFSHYALRIREISLPTSQASLFSLVNENASSGESILVIDSKISVDENRTIMLEVKIDSPKSKNATILIATDRFTKVFETSLNPGLNDIKFEFDYIVDPSWYEAGGFYWLHLTQTRVIVIEDRSIAYNKFVTTLDLKSMNSILLILLLAILTVYLLAQFRQHREQQEQQRQNNASP